MNDNTFGRTSELHITASCKGGATILSECEFTAPFKIMKPFEHRDGSITVMLLQASAGIMEGDRQHMVFDIEPGARIEFVSQSYDKVHPMKDGWAEREIEIHVAGGSHFLMRPQPMIPFAHSRFRSRTLVELEDETADFAMNEILTAGRLGHDGEKFQFDWYRNLVEIRRGNRLIYRDNTRYEPETCRMDDLGMYETWTHLDNLFLSGNDSRSGAVLMKPGTAPAPESLYDRIWDILDASEKTEGGVTKLDSGDLAVRLFAHRAQDLETMSAQIIKTAR